MICCVLNIIVSGQVKKPPIKPKPTPAPKIENLITELEAKTKDGKKVILRSNGTWVYFKEEFDERNPVTLTIRKVPIPFVADDVKQVINFLEKNEFPLQKSEYETEQEYSIRLNKIQYETKSFTDITFRFTLKQEYDAENERFSFTLYNSLNYRAFSELQLVRRRGNELRTYEPDLSFKMSREQAKEVGNNLDVAVFGYPVKVDKQYSDKRLLFLLKRISIFNGKTGEVYYEQEDFEPKYLGL
jgi:hypothetical protein